MVYDDRMSDYIEVKDRVQAFHKQYPDGSLQSEYEIRQLGDKTWIIVKAYAYRTPDDPRPGVGHAWESYPGSTPFTRTSELMVGETSAWGRALAALGIAVSKSIASKNEVRAAEARKVERAKETPPDDPFYTDAQPPAPKSHIYDTRKRINVKQIGLLRGKLKAAGVADDALIDTVNGLLTLGGLQPITLPAELTNGQLDHVLNNLDKIVTVEEYVAEAFTPEDYIEATGK
jgi:hypothetical protein